MVLIAIWTMVAFLNLIAYEIIKVRNYTEGENRRNRFFTLGVISLAFTWIISAISFWNTGEVLGMNYRTRLVVGGVCTLAALVFYIYILWGALPKGTYEDDVQSSLMDTGIYGACRHPGFYGFTLTALAVALLVGSKAMLILMLIHSALNLGYIYLQDTRFFPVYLEGYDEYRERVPFLGFRK